MTPEDLNKLLHKVYTDVDEGGSFTSSKKIQSEIVRKFKIKIKIKDIQEWLDKNLAYGLHRRALQSFKRNPIISPYLDDQWEVHLMFVPDLKGVYIGALICIDVASRYVWG